MEQVYNPQLSLRLMHEDRRMIAYRPVIASALDNILAALLLQQIIFHYKGRPFYKFRDACPKQPLYQPGDSWIEELMCNKGEFDNALKCIGTKIMRGDSKKDVLATELPERHLEETDSAFLERMQNAFRALVLYWTDSNHVTWYQINEALLDKFINRIYLDKSYSLKHLRGAVIGGILKTRKAETDDSETPTETPTKKKKILPSIDGEPLFSFFEGPTLPWSFPMIWEQLFLRQWVSALVDWLLLNAVEEKPAEPEPVKGKKSKIVRTPDENRAIEQILDAYLKANHSLNGRVYGNETLREYALAVYKARFEPVHVQLFIEWVKEDTWWKTKHVSMEKVANEISDWYLNAYEDGDEESAAGGWTEPAADAAPGQGRAAPPTDLGKTIDITDTLNMVFAAADAKMAVSR